MNTSQSVAETRAPRILLVDDMPDTLVLMNGLFDAGCEVVQAPSGKAALKIVMSADAPDIVLLDSLLSDMNAKELLRRIRQHPPTADIPVLFVAAMATADAGADGVDCLVKPVDPALVMERLEAHLQATAQVRRVKALSDKLARLLSPEDWRHIFEGPGLETLRFEEKVQTVLHVEGDGANWGERERDSFTAEVEWLAVRHGGRVDHFLRNAAAIAFDEPVSCVRMAMDLQRSAAALHLRMGIHTGACEAGMFRSAHQACWTLIGADAAARVAASAATGSIAISPQAYPLVKDGIDADVLGCLVMEEFQDSNLAQVCLTPTPAKGGQALSTFAGLGLVN